MYWTNKFNEFNKKYWDGKLTKIPVKIRNLSTDRAEGLYHYPDEEEGTGDPGDGDGCQHRRQEAGT